MSSDNTIYSLAAAMKKHQYELQIKNNNMANMNTNGFRELVNVESSAMRKTQDGETSFPIAGYTIQKDTPGTIINTNQKLDVAIVGSGWFKIMTPLGVRYTRNGHFTINSDNMLVDMQGNSVMSNDGGGIQFNLTDVDPIINGDGSILSNNELRGQIAIVEFADNTAPRNAGDNLYTHNAPESPASGRMQQGSLEQSNVNSISIVTELMELERQHTAVMQQINERYSLQRKAINAYGKAGG